MAGQVVGYVRVSSIEQNPDRQIHAIGAVDATFTVSGKSRADRPALAQMLRHVRHGNTLRVASMDGLARSAVDLAQLVPDMTGRGVTVQFGNTPDRRLVLAIPGCWVAVRERTDPRADDVSV